MTLDDVYKELLVVASEAGTQIDVPIESEQFFEGLLSGFSGSKDEFIEHVRANIGEWFRCVGEGPRWIQEAEWQFHDGQPMVFLGQIDIPKSAGLFHDDASVLAFLSPCGVTKNVIQVA